MKKYLLFALVAFLAVTSASAQMRIRMGKNTMERQNFIIDNLVIEEDIPDEDSDPLD